MNKSFHTVDLVKYVTRFQWDMAKYPIKQSLKNISEIMSKLASQIDSDLKARSSAYNSLKGKVLETESGEKQSLERKNLTSYPGWQKTRETLSEMGIPRSTKFTVRGFQYNEEEMKADKEEMTRLSTDKKKQFGPLVRWLKVNFSEAFISWIHIKALRVFTEYGLPVSFQAMLLQPNEKNVKKLREGLQDLYKLLDSSATVIDASMDIPGLNLSQQEYYPYVYYKIDCNLLDFK
ncbi:V-type proton ATPase subunit C 1-B isoform X2 [Carassius gibelio]|uniref:V-type proton ATPase subunit C 1-B isoform X2 n=1 Tax=Carassius gibelio TaxID=101364 RepID=UPI002279815E|nr:V-type proton ATPase subunit C 1-B isoform X2 [Carassius gibelio]